MLFWGSKGVNRDMAAAVQYYRQLALAGDVNAHYDLGEIFQYSQPVCPFLLI